MTAAHVATPQRVALIQHFFYNSGEIGANKMTLVAMNDLSPADVALLKKVSGHSPTEDEVSHVELLAVEAIENKGWPAHMGSLVGPTEYDIAVLCQLYYG